MRQRLRYMCLFLWPPFISFAQTNTVLKEGQIIFEKKINMYAINGTVSNDYKKNYPQFRITHFTLEFSPQKNLYMPSAENQELPRAGAQPAENNIVYTENPGGQYQSMKRIMQQDFTVQDTLPKISWKITDEKTNIAGFECRRANAIILDSVYVVAFYADNIPVSAGPELFSGLPGMILGVSLPHQHITWFATRIFSQPVKDESLRKPTPKKSPISNRQLLDRLVTELKSWDNYNTALIQSLL